MWKVSHMYSCLHLARKLTLERIAYAGKTAFVTLQVPELPIKQTGFRTGRYIMCHIGNLR